MSKFRVIICCLIALLLASMSLASGYAAENPALSKTKAATRNAAWQSITAGKTGSVSVAVTENGKLVYAESFGMADRERSIPVDENTLFNIGSISKVYVTTAIMLLVDDGKVELDKPVIAYLPEFTMADARHKDITVRMLLNHSSGLPGTTGRNNVGYEYHQDFTKTYWTSSPNPISSTGRVSWLPTATTASPSPKWSWRKSRGKATSSS